MNREIKFRAWDTEEQKMIEWNNEFFYDTSPVTGFTGDFSNIRFPLMQYTGLHDKNGKEIYEGDVVEFNDLSTFYLFKEQPRGRSVIKWDERKCGWESPRGTSYIEGEKLEVIGNIYENPELLEVKS
ncbi:YopX family protein [Gracilibacillus saliphilus]|uniref:YopX family protein n=1 Tax=Gracilibacillus saliphilus TaxID=543890 RepID=UPI0013D6E0A8|nr:YopX family protein [Gracilibacillus saliphilus]